MKKISITLFTALATLAFATSQELDILQYEGSEYRITTFPLSSYDLDLRLRVEPKSGFVSSGNYRGYVATWIITEGKLYLVNVDGWIEQYSHSEKEYLSDQKEYPRPFRMKKFYTYERATLELLFPHEVAEGKVFASWFSGELYTGGYRPAAERSEEFIENQKKHAELIFQITNGNIESVLDKRNPNQALEPTPAGAAHR
jgi:hypothetical protein